MGRNRTESLSISSFDFIKCLIDANLNKTNFCCIFKKHDPTTRSRILNEIFRFMAVLYDFSFFLLSLHLFLGRQQLSFARVCLPQCESRMIKNFKNIFLIYGRYRGNVNDCLCGTQKKSFANFGVKVELSRPFFRGAVSKAVKLQSNECLTKLNGAGFSAENANEFGLALFI